MGLFNRNRAKGFMVSEDDTYRLHQPTLDEMSEQMKATAIEYIVSLNKADKDRFFAGVELIWQGYNVSVDKVLTKHQRSLRKEAGEAGMDADDDLLGLLEDEPKQTPVLPKTDAPSASTQAKTIPVEEAK